MCFPCPCQGSIFLFICMLEGKFTLCYHNYKQCNDVVQGLAGNSPKAGELVLALKNHDLFLYFGHGSGMFKFCWAFSLVIVPSCLKFHSLISCKCS